jgi:hypothetical protein
MRRYLDWGPSQLLETQDSCDQGAITRNTPKSVEGSDTKIAVKSFAP